MKQFLQEMWADIRLFCALSLAGFLLILATALFDEPWGRILGYSGIGCFGVGLFHAIVWRTWKREAEQRGKRYATAFVAVWITLTVLAMAAWKR